MKLYLQAFLCVIIFVFFSLFLLGVKALNRTHFSLSSHSSHVVDGINFVTVFSIYNSPLNTGDRSSELVTVGHSSYNKVQRSMAILNVFINFIQASFQKAHAIIFCYNYSICSFLISNVSKFSCAFITKQNICSQHVNLNECQFVTFGQSCNFDI